VPSSGFRPLPSPPNVLGLTSLTAPRDGRAVRSAVEENDMATNAEKAYELFKADEGKPEGTGDWFEITQERINQFADVTEDHQFIHVDPEKCKDLSPYGVPIAHGFLTLSLLSHLNKSIRRDLSRYAGAVAGVNYGFDKVRFIAPVKVGSKIRVSSVLKAVELKDPNTLHTTSTVTIEIDGEEKPALVADWVNRTVFS
jgi:acyl dehydratase